MVFFVFFAYSIDLSKESIVTTWASVKTKSLMELEKTMNTYQELHDKFAAELGK